MKLLLSAFVSLMSTSAFAVQYIDCIPMPVENTDRVIVSLKDYQTGTLFITSGIASDGSTEDSGVLKLTAAPAISSLAAFTAENELVNFTFLMPAEIVQKPFSGYFDAQIVLNPKDGASEFKQTLNCFTRIYPDSL